MCSVPLKVQRGGRRPCEGETQGGRRKYNDGGGGGSISRALTSSTQDWRFCEEGMRECVYDDFSFLAFGDSVPWFTPFTPLTDDKEHIKLE